MIRGGRGEESGLREISKDYRIAAVATGEHASVMEAGEHASAMEAGEHASVMEAVGQALSAHPDQRFRSYLVRGIREVPWVCVF